VTLTKANTLSKCIFNIFLISIICFFCTSADCKPSDGESNPDVLPWGASFQGLKHVYPGMIRTYAGLNDYQRTRIAKFLRDDKLFGYDVRVYYSFKSNRLFEVQYNFKKPDRNVFARVFAILTEKLGTHFKQNLKKKPTGDLFIDRAFQDYIWQTDKSNINLRWIDNVFKERPTVNSLFVTFRAKSVKKNKPRQMMPDEEIKPGSGNKAITIAFTGAFSLGNYLENASRIAGYKNPIEYPFAKLQERFKEISFFAGILENSFLENEKVKEKYNWVKTLEKSNFKLLSVFAKDSGNNFSPLSSEIRNDFSNSEVTVSYPYELSDDVEFTLKKINGIAFGFFLYIVKDGSENFQLSERIKTHILKFKKAGGEIPVVFLYWDNKKEICRTEGNMLFAQSVIDSGAFLVVGYNPNGMMPLQEYGNGLILYSPGKLLSSNLDKKMISESMIFLVTFNKMGIIGYDIVPAVSSSSASNAFQVQFPKDNIKKMILERFSKMNNTCEN